jgi:hypothetical protein
MPDLRVPPAVTFAFEKVVASVCDQAKLEAEDWPLRARELLNYFQERWREGVEMGLSTEEAQSRALEMFGPSKLVARSLREVWWKRLIFQRRCRAARNMVFLSSSFVCSAISTTVTNNFHKLPMASGALTSGVFMNGLLALGSAWLIAWKPRIPYVLVQMLFSLRHILWLLVFSGFLNVVSVPPIELYRVLTSSNGNLISMGWFLVSWIYGCLGGACLVSESLNLAGRRKAVSLETMAFQALR